MFYLGCASLNTCAHTKNVDQSFFWGGGEGGSVDLSLKLTTFNIWLGAACINIFLKSNFQSCILEAMLMSKTIAISIKYGLQTTSLTTYKP